MVFGDPAELAAYQQLVEAFKAVHPDIQVELRHVASQGDYQKQLVTAFSAGAEPDVMLLNYRRVLQFAAEGGLEPVGPYLDKSQSLHAADLYPEALEAFQWDGKTWCIPQNVSSLVVYYNRALFDAAGVAYPTAGWTWDDFLQTARALTRDLDGDGQTDQYGAGVSPELMRLAPFIWQNGGELVDDPAQPTRLALDSPAALAAFQWFVDLQVKEQVVPDATAEQAEESETRFMNGRLGMFLNSRRGVPTYPHGRGPGLGRGAAATGRAGRRHPAQRRLLPVGQGPGQGVGLDADRVCQLGRRTNADGRHGPHRPVAAPGGRVAGLPRLRSSGRPAAGSSWTRIPLLRRVPLLPKWPTIEETASREIERAFYGQASVEEAAAAAISLTSPYFQGNMTRLRNHPSDLVKRSEGWFLSSTIILLIL